MQLRAWPGCVGAVLHDICSSMLLDRYGGEQPAQIILEQHRGHRASAQGDHDDLRASPKPLPTRHGRSWKSCISCAVRGWGAC
eukprot:15048930-Alexandrium_andersonii.AAC.1